MSSVSLTGTMLLFSCLLGSFLPIPSLIQLSLFPPLTFICSLSFALPFSFPVSSFLVVIYTVCSVWIHSHPVCGGLGCMYRTDTNRSDWSLEKQLWNLVGFFLFVYLFVKCCKLAVRARKLPERVKKPFSPKYLECLVRYWYLFVFAFKCFCLFSFLLLWFIIFYYYLT